MNIAGKGSVSAIQSKKSPYAWRKMFQFRIRTLLIAMLILPTGFGLYANRRRDSQKAWNHYYAVQEYIDSANLPPKTRQFSWLTRLGLDMPPIDDGLALLIPPREDEEKDLNEILEHVAQFDSLTSLAVRRVEVSQGSLVPFQRLKKLRELKLDGTYLDRDGLQEIAKLSQLQSLSLYLEGIMKSDTIDEDLHFLAEMPSVERLQFGFGGQARSEGFEAISKAPGLKELSLSHVTQHFANGSPYAKDLLRNGQLHKDDLADEGLAHLAKIHNLESLRLRSANFTGKGMQAICTLSKLETLSMDSQLLGDEDLQHLKQLRNLTTLHLDCPQFTGEGLSYVVGLPSLRSLQMSVRSVTCEDLVQLRQMTKLQSLELYEVDSNDEFVQAISEMPVLQKLYFNSANLTDKQLLQLLKSVSLTEVVIVDSLVTPAGEKQARAIRPNLVRRISQRRSGNMNGVF